MKKTAKDVAFSAEQLLLVLVFVLHLDLQQQPLGRHRLIAAVLEGGAPCPGVHGVHEMEAVPVQEPMAHPFHGSKWHISSYSP